MNFAKFFRILFNRTPPGDCFLTSKMKKENPKTFTLNFIFGYCSRACAGLKTTVYIFCWFLLSRNHDAIGEKFLLTKPIKLGVNGKRSLCRSILAIKLIADFCSFLGYGLSKNASRGHSIKGEFISLAKPIVLCTTRKRTLW